jgi:3-methylcrotonyl-CoA carboxylase alpha subunit
MEACRPRRGGAEGDAVRFVARHDGREIAVEVERHGSGYRVRLDDRWLEADLVSAGPALRSLRLADGTQYALVHHQSGNQHEITLADTTIHVEITDPLALRRRKGDDEMGGGGVVRALMPGRIARVLVAQGASVTKGTGLLILEAMKMENEIQAPIDGIVDRLLVEPGQTVESGAELAHIEG